MTIASADKSTARRRAKDTEKEKDGGERDLLMVNSVEKAFRVLRAFDGSRSSLGLSEVAELAELDMSSAQRFVHTLTRLGYLEKDPASKRVNLTVKCLEIGHAYVRGSGLVKQALPFLLHLNKETEETVNLTVRDDLDIVFVARFLSRHVFSTDVVIGSRLPAYCTAPGRAILACLPADTARSLVERGNLRSHTPDTPTSVDEVMRRVELARERGYALQSEEYFRGDISIAAPVIGPDGLALGAINLASSTSRYTLAELESRFAQQVVAAAHSISSLTR